MEDFDVVYGHKMNEVPRRRADDVRIEKMVEDIAALNLRMAENTEITKEVRDFLATLRTLAKIAKWVTAISGAIWATVAAIKTGADFPKP